MREALLYKKLNGSVVECTACPRRCKLKDGQFGFCGIRWNFYGRLWLTVYGKLIAIAVDPIEKKPLMHYNPGSMVLSIATTGCNWMCMYCQNFDISQRRRVEGWELNPEDIVKLAHELGAHGITYTYNEPTIFIEFARDTGILAHKHGLFNTFVTNGYMTDESIDLASKFLDAATVDFKGNANPDFLKKFSGVPNPEEVFHTISELKRKGVFIEITDLVVPKIGDDLNYARKLVKWIVENLGPETPVHFLRFHPDYKLTYLPWTPVETLEKHVKIAKEEGLHYVYIGNVPGHPYENTYCPNCGRLVIKRYGFDIIEWYLDNQNRCKYCGFKINIAGHLHKEYKINRFVYVPIDAIAKYVSLEPQYLRSIASSLIKQSGKSF